METGTATLYRRENGVWYYWTYDEIGNRKRFSTGRKTKAAAKVVVAERIRTGRLLDPKGRKKVSGFAEFCEDFYIYEKCPYIQGRVRRGYKYSKKQAKTNRYYLEHHILPFFKTRAIETISVGDINRWLIQLPETSKISNKTANNILTILRQIFQVAVEDGLREDNPAEKVRPLAKNANSKRRLAFSRDQISKLFSESWSSNVAEVAARLAAQTGMRAGEIRALSPEQIHPDHIEVDASYNNHDDGRKCTKSGYSRIVPIGSEIYQMLQEIASGGPYVFSFDGIKPVSNSYFEKKLLSRMKDLGIKAPKGTILSFHSFRHYFNSRLTAAGIQGEKIRAVIGHEEEEMTEHYTHLELEDLKQILQVQRMAIA